MLLPRQTCGKISLGQSKRDLSLPKEARENHYRLNSHLMFPGKQFIECTACSPPLLVGKLCGVDNPGAFSCQGAKRIITPYLLLLINLSLPSAYSARIRTTEKTTEMCHIRFTLIPESPRHPISPFLKGISGKLMTFLNGFNNFGALKIMRAIRAVVIMTGLPRFLPLCLETMGRTHPISI